MEYRWSVDGAKPEGVRLCFVRSRRLWPVGESCVYEAVTQRGGRLQVLGRSRRVTRGSPAAAAALMKLDQDLRRDGWTPTERPHTVGDDVAATYARPVRLHFL